MTPTGLVKDTACEICSVGFVSPVCISTFGNQVTHLLCPDCEAAAEAVMNAAVDMVLIRCHAIVAPRKAAA